MDGLGTEPGRVSALPDAQDAEEKEEWANAFAAAILMPAEAIRGLYASGRTVREIARCLHVTTAAVEHRLAGLELTGTVRG